MNLRDYEGIILEHKNDVGKAYNQITWKVKNGKCYMLYQGLPYGAIIETLKRII